MENRLSNWRKTMVNVHEIDYEKHEEIEHEERRGLGLSRGRARTKSIQLQPVVLLPDGKLEIQDIGTTLGDLLRYYPNYYLIESYHSNSPKPHRSASYVLRDDGAYKLVKDDMAIDVKEEFTSLHEKIEELISENSQLQNQLQEVLSLAIQTRKDQLVVKQNFSSSNCYNCRESLKFKLSQRCKMCDQEFCSICVIRISFPVGFRKSKNILFQATKKCCVNCLSAVFYLRNNPPLDHLLTVNTVIIEKILNNAQNIIPSSLSSATSSASVLSTSKPLSGTGKLHGKLPAFLRRRNDNSPPQNNNANLSSGNILKNAGEFDGYTGSYFTNGTFYSSGNLSISLPLKFLDPLCRLTFWFGGVGEDLKFDRKTIDKATGTRYTASNKANKIIAVEVPEFWPELLSNEECALGRTAPITCETVHNLELLVFMPSKMVGPWPVVIFFHGGGFCVGRPTDQIYENSCAKMAMETGCVVVSVDYRLAPESKFPTQIEDSYAAIIWVYENHKVLNIDREKIIVCGDSAGGSLAAVTSMMARDRKGPKITHQILVYPCITFPLDDSLESHIKYKDGPILSQKILKWFLTQLFPNGEDSDKDLKSNMDHIYASPILANLEHLPPATIINAYHDPLRDQGEIYMEKLRASGVKVTRTVYRRSTHGFYGAPTKESDECLMEICCAIRLAFGLDSLDIDYLNNVYLKHLKD